MTAQPTRKMYAVAITGVAMLVLQSILSAVGFVGGTEGLEPLVASGVTAAVTFLAGYMTTEKLPLGYVEKT